MASDKVICSTAKISAIADAIREKASLTSPLLLDDMPEAILHIPSGGGEDDGLVKYVNYTGGRGLFAYTDVSEAELEMLPLSQLNITDGYRLFQNCTTITNIPTTLNLSNCTNLEYAFYGCTGLTSIPEEVVATLTNVTNLNSALSGCSNLTGDYIFDLEQATSLNYFLSSSKVENVVLRLHTATPMMQYFLNSASNVKNVTLDFCDTSNPKCYSSYHDSYYYINCNCTLDSLTLKGMAKWTNTIYPILSSSTYAKSVTFEGLVNKVPYIKSKSGISSSDPKVEILTYKNCSFNSLSYLFYGYKSLQQVNFENCTFTSSTYAEYTFYYANFNDWSILDQLPFDNITSLYYTFYGSNYDGYNIEKFSSDKIVSASYAFCKCPIKRIPNNFKLRYVKYSPCFSGCTELIEIGDGFEYGTQVHEQIWSYVGGWFSGCSKLKKIPRLDYNLVKQGAYSNENFYYRMFSGCSALDRVDVNNLPRFRESDFENCTSLKVVVSRNTQRMYFSANCFKNTPILDTSSDSFIYVPKAQKNYYPDTSSSQDVSYSKIKPFISLESGETYTADPLDTDAPFDPVTQELLLLDLDEYLKAELDADDNYVITTPPILATLSGSDLSYTSDKARETIGLLVRDK